MGEQSFLNNLVERLSRLEKDMAEIRQVMVVQEALPQQPRTTIVSKVSSNPQTEASGDWNVTCFGRFSHRCGEREVLPCRSRRGQSVLKYLLTSQGHAVSAEHLIDCFWPETNAVAGAHNLQMAVYMLRHSLQGCGPDGGDETVLFCDNRYQLNPALTITLDVDMFRAAYQRGQEALAQDEVLEAIKDLEQARSYYQGDYLADPYEDWASTPRRSLRDLWLTLLNQLSLLYFQVENWEGSASCCHEILTVDSTREDSSRQLMRCYAATGRVADVKRVYRACQECLLQELRLSPTPATRALFHQLIDQLTSPEDY